MNIVDSANLFTALYVYIVEVHCHGVELEMGEFVSNSRGIESQ